MGTRSELYYLFDLVARMHAWRGLAPPHKKRVACLTLPEAKAKVKEGRGEHGRTSEMKEVG